MRRHPAVAGSFYRSTSAALRQQIEPFIDQSAKKVKALGIISPHAGFIYSGAVAGAVYSRIELPETIVLIGPNHTGLGVPLSLMSEGTWETPLGSVEIDTGFARALLSRSRHIQEDAIAHLREHSLEVQLPFIQYFKQDFKIVPIQMFDTRYEICAETGRALAEVIKEYSTHDERSILIVASSDMSHYEADAVAREKDGKAIDMITASDPEGLYRTVRKYGISMCGYVPVVTMLVACNVLGASTATVIKYSNSGEVSGDYDQVVGYAGVIVS